MIRLPRLVIAAPASGQGKTTVAVGIMAALSRLGAVVAPAKVGPDYIDPGYHALATGRPGRNLDPWLTAPDLIVPLLLHGAVTPTPADIAVIEGVMGLFDGRIGTDGFASTAHIAALTRSPVILVVDISSAARTVAATVHGLATFAAANGSADEQPVDVVGVVLNKAGSPRHADEVRRAVEKLGCPVLGVLPRDAGIAAPSRHLGLVPAAERADAASGLDRLAEQTAQHLDLALLRELASAAPELAAQPWSPPGATGTGQPRTVAVAGGRAFTFRYAETDEMLRANGCEPVIVDPATDRALPAGTSGLYLGGGFPEAHAGALAANRSLLADIREAVLCGMPTVAECAGLLYLCRSLDGHPLVGAVPAAAAMSPRLTLRYRTARLGADSILGSAGTTVATHEFHRTRTDPAFAGPGAWQVDGTPHGFALDPAGFGCATVHASYLHVHWAGSPQLARSFAEAVRAFGPAGASTRGGGASRALRCTDLAPAAPYSATDPAGCLPATDPLAHHGDAELRGDGARLVDLAVNVRVAAPPAWLAEEIRSSVDHVAAYPDVSQARAALAARHGLPAEMVLPTAGAAEAFTLLARAVPGRHPLVVHPQFTEPEAALRRAGRVPQRHLLRAGDGFTLDPATVDSRADLVIVGNPTNPTAVLHRRETLQALRRPDRVLVVDEAFADAVPGEPETLVGQDLTGVLVLRSLTKTWGLAGLRAGYVVGDPELVAALERHQPPWSVSTPAAVVMAAVARPAAVQEAELLARQAQEDRAHLVAGLVALGLRPVQGRAPFVLVDAGVGVREALRGKGYAVRRGDTFPGLSERWIRIAVRDRCMTDGFLAALTDVLAEPPGSVAHAAARPVLVRTEQPA